MLTLAAKKRDKLTSTGRLNVSSQTGPRVWALQLVVMVWQRLCHRWC